MSDSVYRKCTEKTNAEQQREMKISWRLGGEGNGEFWVGMRTFWNEIVVMVAEL